MGKNPEGIVRNTFFNSVAGMAGKVGGLLFTVVIAKLLGPGSFGEFALAMSVITFVTAFAGSGLHNTMLRFVANPVLREKRQTSGFFYLILAAKVALTLVLAWSFALLTPENTQAWFGSRAIATLFVVGAAVFASKTLQEFFSFALMGVQDFKGILYSETLFQVARFALAVYLIQSGLGSLGPLYATLLAAVAALLLEVLLLATRNQHVLVPFNFSKNKAEVASFLKYTSIFSILSIGLANVDPIIAGILFSTEDVGFLRTATAIPTALAVAFGVGVLYPAFVESKKERLELVANKGIYYLALGGSLAAALVSGLSVETVQVLFGEKYLPAAALLAVTAYLMILEGVNGAFLGLYFARDKPKTNAKIHAVVFALDVALGYYLGSQFGLLGLVSGIVASRSIMTALYWFNARQAFGLRLDALKPLKLLLSAVLVAVFLKLLPAAGALWAAPKALLVVLAFTAVAGTLKAASMQDLKFVIERLMRKN